MKYVYFVGADAGIYHKAREVVALQDVDLIWANYDIAVPSTLPLVDVVTERALRAFDIIKKPCVVVASAFCVHELGGFPGVAHDFVRSHITLEGILSLVEDRDRLCSIREIGAYVDDDGVFTSKVSVVDGNLSLYPRGIHFETPYQWSEWYHIFIPSDLGKLVVEIPVAEYLEWRGQQVAKLFSARYSLDQRFSQNVNKNTNARI